MSDLPADFTVTRRAIGEMAAGGAAALWLPSLLGGCVMSRENGSTPAGADGLRRVPPQAEGVDPQSVLAFLDDVASQKLELHSFMLARNGRVMSEGWWWPYRADRPHMFHSATKSFAVSGIAIAVGEGRFALDDKVISFFPDELPSRVSDNLAAMRVRDLLTMQAGHAQEISGSVWRQIKTSWVAEFLKIPVVHRPGTRFLYSSAASFMLSAIVTKTTGQTLREYMEPRFFGPLGIRDISWDVGPGGINPGGNGLTGRTSDLLKLGILHAQGGRWDGRQILPAGWVNEATAPQVATGEYGYQWWMGPDSTYYALGLFTQLSIVFPDHDAVLAITGAIDGSAKLLPTIWKHFHPVFGPGKVSTATGADAMLRERTAALRLLPPLAFTSSPVAQRVSGRDFRLQRNEEQVEGVRFTFVGPRCRFELRDHRGTHTIDVGLAEWIEGRTSMTGNKLHHQYQPDTMVVVAGGCWVDPDTFEMTWQFAETAFRDRVV